MTSAPRSCWRSWLSPALAFVTSYRPLQAHHLVTFACNRIPQLDRVAFRKPPGARRNFPVRCYPGRESISTRQT